MTTATHCASRPECCVQRRDVRLAYVHEYSETDLDEVLAEIGYTTLNKFHGAPTADQERVVLLYILRRH